MILGRLSDIGLKLVKERHAPILPCPTSAVTRAYLRGFRRAGPRSATSTTPRVGYCSTQ